jgi:hypothetical protein
MRNIFSIPILLFVIIFAQISCKEAVPTLIPASNEGVVVLNFKAQYDNTPLVMYKTYILNGKKIQFSSISFMITKICPSANLDCSGRSAMVDFSSQTDSLKASAGVSDTIKIEAGAYSSLTFGLGVDSIDNKQTPAQFAPTSALGDGQNYWYGWSGYIFLKIHGAMDLKDNGKFDTPVTLDTGGNSSYRSFGATRNIILSSTPTVFNFQVNVNRMLQNFDVVKTPSTQNLSDLPYMQILMDNLQSSISVN